MTEQHLDVTGVQTLIRIPATAFVAQVVPMQVAIEVVRRVGNSR